mgnify:CR=1 FL=1
MKKSLFAMAAILGLALTSCSSDDNNKSDENKSTFVLKVDDLKGNINDGTVTLDPTQTYTLTGGLVVKGGATLVIPAGTVIKSSATAPATSLYIAVERNAKININGTAAKPVIMTSGKATPAQSDWGGLIIAGNGKVNTGDNGTSEVGGLLYGGNNNADSSGKITYLKISYTGSKFSATKEYNGVSFFGVGSGTEVSNIYTFESGDDAIEFFGGAVNASNLIMINSYDDSLDFADGYVGTVTNAYISGVTFAGVEGSNNAADPLNALPLTDGKVVNMTIVKGADAKFTASEKALNFKEGTGKQTYTNLFIDATGISTLAKISTDAGTTARIAAGDIKVNGTNFTSANNTTAAYVTNQTGAGSGATKPTWASWTN